ncbi:gamma-glutamylcyclotransferase [Paenibacillus rhizovicinus]|uniref:Gamma-glutamylcyclotransferase n=1 Tax=Paenibacillus rhizovicinus TaxID=2704463 RepID=A0A6C0P9Y0_9BACL|nr:gamma-glutamylcyclotransferase family protein [Paenibacillus rhizovicinus]QHW33332.1 gamma-glutamylcyclotransferase [Paenibacillus rhizovicinus]
MSERELSVFIYGTLLPGQSNHDVAAPFIRRMEPGVVRGRLVDYGAYPAMLRDAETHAGKMRVRGLWITVNEQGLKQMDELEQFYGIEEENDYDRVWAEDLESPLRQGWVYVWDHPRGCPAIKGNYWPDHLARKEGRNQA